MGLGKKGAAHGVGTVGMCVGIAGGAVGVPWSCCVGAARNCVVLVNRWRESVVIVNLSLCGALDRLCQLS